MAVQRVLLRLVHSAELSDQVRGIPAFQQNVHFLTNIGQNKCGNVLHDPLFIHFLWRSRSGRPNLIFWESKRALAIPGLLCIPASVLYRHASNSRRYVFEACISYCSQASMDLGNWATRKLGWQQPLEYCKAGIREETRSWKSTPPVAAL